jgi:hypothetical protein
MHQYRVLRAASLLAACFVLGSVSRVVAAGVDVDRKGLPPRAEGEREKLEKGAKPELDHEDSDEVGEHRDQHAKLVKEGEENLKEIRRLLDEIQKELAGRKTDAGLQARQREAVQKMEELVRKLVEQSEKCGKFG